MYFVYILANKKNGTLYIGFTTNLIKRVWEHKNELADGFTKKYGINKLVYFESSDVKEGVLQREKRLKKWNRAWKIKLIKEVNPNWDDLYYQITR